MWQEEGRGEHGGVEVEWKVRPDEERGRAGVGGQWLLRSQPHL